MARPERYQLGFDFGQKPDRPLVYYELGIAGREHPEEGGGDNSKNLFDNATELV